MDIGGGIAYAYKQSEYATNAWSDRNIGIKDTGGGQGHNHKIPYIAVFLWRRTE